jgi:hypothetical protein
MAFLKCSSIYDVVIIFQRGYWIPDGTLKADHSVTTKPKDIIYLALFGIACIILGLFAFNSDRKILESNSKLLNGGIDFAVKFGFFLAFAGRLVLFWWRFKLWKIVETLEKCDFLVIRSVIWNL